jgi:7,8-dihydropterin-6-yl-methyl-4-(beta-D-ribofuranosyl)aminobenzene 5'-phosphate synthase
MRTPDTQEVAMRFTASLAGGWLAALLSIAGCAYTAQQIASPEAVAPAQITVLYDAFGKEAGMTKDWGYSAFVEVAGKRVLFDTGNNGEVLAANARAKGIDLSRLDFVVMSHRHGDHMGGLAYLLSVNPRVKIYAPKEGFGVYGADLPSAFYRKEPALPPEQRYYDGAPPEVMRFGSAWPGANIRLIDKTTEIAPGLHLIALVSDKPGTLELRELSLAIDTAEGMVIVVGCAHPGIENIVKAVAAINPRIHLIAGGLHLVVAKDADIEATISALHDSFRVAWIATGHCTGEPTFAALRRAYGERQLYAGLGTRIALGGMPRASGAAGAASSSAFDEHDRRSYLALLATSDDGPQPAAALAGR